MLDNLLPTVPKLGLAGGMLVVANEESDNP